MLCLNFQYSGKARKIQNAMLYKTLTLSWLMHCLITQTYMNKTGLQILALSSSFYFLISNCHFFFKHTNISFSPSVWVSDWPKHSLPPIPDSSVTNSSAALQPMHKANANTKLTQIFAIVVTTSVYTCHWPRKCLGTVVLDALHALVFWHWTWTPSHIDTDKHHKSQELHGNRQDFTKLTKNTSYSLPGPQSRGFSVDQHSSEAVAPQGLTSSRWKVSPKSKNSTRQSIYSYASVERFLQLSLRMNP